MQLLLVTEEKIAARETPSTIRALEGLLLGVRALMALQVLQSGERATTSGTNMRTRFVCFWWWDVPIGDLAIGLGLLVLFVRSYRVRGSAFEGR